MDFMNMLFDYDLRKIARYEQDNILISTAEVTDSIHPYETALRHPFYNEGELIVVETYDDREIAREGHDKWVAIMTADELPESLRDVSTATAAFLKDAFHDDDWRTHHKIIDVTERRKERGEKNSSPGLLE